MILLLLVACTPSQSPTDDTAEELVAIRGTVLGETPSGSRAVVLWQGHDAATFGSVGDLARVSEDGKFTLHPDLPKIDGGYLGLGSLETGLVALVDADFDPSHPIAPESWRHVLAVDPDTFVHREDASAVAPYGEGTRCIDCREGGREDFDCAPTPCDGFELIPTDNALTSPWSLPAETMRSGGPSVVLDDGRIYYGVKVFEGAPAEIPGGLFEARAGVPRRLLHAVPSTGWLAPTSAHDNGLVAAIWTNDLHTSPSSGRAGVFDANSGASWSIPWEYPGILAGPVLSPDGTMVATAQMGEATIYDARTGAVLASNVSVGESWDGTALVWSAETSIVYVFPVGMASALVAVGDATAADWPTCFGPASTTEQRCPADPDHEARFDFLGQPLAAAPPASWGDCVSLDFDAIPRQLDYVETVEPCPY